MDIQPDALVQISASVMLDNPALSAAPVAKQSTERSLGSLYLIGEEDRSTQRPASAAADRTAISINGRWHRLRGTEVSYGQIMRLAFGQAGGPGWQVGTVTFRNGGAAIGSGILSSGDIMPLTDGLLFNAVLTDAS